MINGCVSPCCIAALCKLCTSRFIHGASPCTCWQHTRVGGTAAKYFVADVVSCVFVMLVYISSAVVMTRCLVWVLEVGHAAKRVDVNCDVMCFRVAYFRVVVPSVVLVRASKTLTLAIGHVRGCLRALRKIQRVVRAFKQRQNVTRVATELQPWMPTVFFTFPPR